MNQENSYLCEVCRKTFPLKELFPVALMRHSLVRSAKLKHPGLNPEGFVCLKDLGEINAFHFEEILKKERGPLSELEKEVVESLKEQETLSEDVNEEYEKQSTLGDRLADKLAEFGGSWVFILFFLSVIVIWMAYNSRIYFQESFDPYPFILLNLVLSCLAAIQAPIILMSQNRQSERERMKLEHDYRVNLKAELQVRQLNSRMDFFMKHYWAQTEEMTRMIEDLLNDGKES